jgi:hypothetical protein
MISLRNVFEILGIPVSCAGLVPIDSELPNIPARGYRTRSIHLALGFRQARKLHLKLGKRQASVRFKIYMASWEEL